MGRILLILSFFAALASCSTGRGPAGSEGPVAPPPHSETPSSEAWAVGDAATSFTRVGSGVPDDPDLEAMVEPFRSRMGEEIQEVIGHTTGLLAKSWPEGTLGNLAADAMLWSANQAHDRPVQMALTNNGGLRVPIGEGPITVGQMFELMPFENLLSVLTLSGEQVQALCDQVAGMRGEPVAGFSFHIEEGPAGRVATEIMVAGAPLDPEAEYLLVTNDYLANGGGSLTPLHNPLARQDLPVLLRDALIDYVRQVGTIEPAIEGRITGGIGS